MRKFVFDESQLFHFWNKAHTRGVDICIRGIGIDTTVEDKFFRDYLATLKSAESVPARPPAPSPAVAGVPSVESHTWIEWRYEKHVRADEPMVRLSDIAHLLTLRPVTVAVVERDLDQIIQQRDDAEELITEVAEYFGCAEEWSSVHSHFDCVREAIAEGRPQ